MLQTPEQPGYLRISANARACKSCIEVRFWPFQVGQPSAILILPALVNRMPPKTSSMYPSSISRALCSDGMRCIKPLAPSRSETNSSRVNGGADGAILGICSYGGRDQETSRVHLAALRICFAAQWAAGRLPRKNGPAPMLDARAGRRQGGRVVQSDNETRR